MRRINAADNDFSLFAVVSSDVHTEVNLGLSGVMFVVDENGEQQEMKRFFE